MDYILPEEHTTRMSLLLHSPTIQRIHPLLVDKEKDHTRLGVVFCVHSR